MRLPHTLIFKGGTSLSKCYRVIARFSEDVDLSFDRKDFGFADARDPAQATTGRRALLDDLKQHCEQTIRTVFVPALDRDFASVLGAAGSQWRIEIDPDDAQTVNFIYPRGLVSQRGTVPEYLRQAVRLELGARSDAWPHSMCTIRPYAAEAFPSAFATADCAVNTLTAERTFWEKATLLHAEAHRAEPEKKAERMSRHYYDLYLLAQSTIGEQALRQLDLLEHVVAHKQVFFRSQWAHYETAVPGSFRLLPPPARVAVLRADYAQMQPMIFGIPPAWAAIIDGLAALERRINSLACTTKVG